MLLWQPISLYKKNQLLIHIILFSTGIHIVCASWLFFWYKQEQYHLSFCINKNLTNTNEPIVFIQTLQKKLLKNNTSLLSKQVVPTNAPTKKNKVENITVVKKIVPLKKPQTVLKVPVVEKKLPIKKQEKVPLVESIKKEIPKNNSSDTKSEDDSVKASVKFKKHNIIPLKSDVSNTKIYATPQQIEQHRQKKLFESILKHNWQPPIGIDNASVCQITFTVGWNKTIQKLIIDISSGILIYDIAARSALYSMIMPEWTKGKTFTLSFRQ